MAKKNFSQEVKKPSIFHMLWFVIAGGLLGSVLLVLFPFDFPLPILAIAWLCVGVAICLLLYKILPFFWRFLTALAAICWKFLTYQINIDTPIQKLGSGIIWLVVLVLMLPVNIVKAIGRSLAAFWQGLVRAEKLTVQIANYRIDIIDQAVKMIGSLIVGGLIALEQAVIAVIVWLKDSLLAVVSFLLIKPIVAVANFVSFLFHAVIDGIVAVLKSVRAAEVALVSFIAHILIVIFQAIKTALVALATYLVVKPILSVVWALEHFVLALVATLVFIVKLPVLITTWIVGLIVKAVRLLVAAVIFIIKLPFLIVRFIWNLIVTIVLGIWREIVAVVKAIIRFEVNLFVGIKRIIFSLINFLIIHPIVATLTAISNFFKAFARIMSISVDFDSFVLKLWHYLPRKLRKTDRVLGIDLRVCAVKVVEMVKTSNGYVVAKWGMKEIPQILLDKHPDKEKAQANAIDAIIKEQQMTARNAAVIVSDREIVVKRVTFPSLTSAADIKSALRLQIEKLINYPVDDAEYAFQKQESDQSDKVEYAVAVAKKELIGRIIGVCKQAHLNISSISVVPLALQAMLGHQLNESESTALIYMGKRATNISIFKGKKFDFNREVAIGGEFITQSMVGVVLHDQGKIELDLAKAEALKREYGIPLNMDEYTQKTGIPAEKMYAMLRPALEKVGAEILRSIDYYGQPLNKIVMVGGSVKTPNLMASLAEALKLKIEEGTSEIKLADGADFTAAFPQLTVALGAGQLKDAGLNLLPNDIQRPWHTMMMKLLNAWTAGAVLGLILLALFFNVSNKKVELDKKLVQLRQQAESQGKDVRQLTPEERIVERLVDSQKKVRLFNEILQQLEEVTPENVYFQDLDYDNKADQFNIKGVVMGKEGRNHLSTYLRQLNETGYFSSIDIAQLEETDKYGTTAFDFKLKCLLLESRKNG
ncbi:MAG: pilus assembly protein PilM [bacterium]